MASSSSSSSLPTTGTSNSTSTTIITSTLDNTIIDSVALIIWKQFCRYYIYIDDDNNENNDGSNDESTTNERPDTTNEVKTTTTTTTDLSQQQQQLAEIQKEIIYYMNDSNIQYQIYKTTQLQTNQRIEEEEEEDVYSYEEDDEQQQQQQGSKKMVQDEINNNNNNNNNNLYKIDPKVLVVLQKAVVQLLMNNTTTIENIIQQKKKELQKKQLHKATATATTTKTKINTGSFSLFSLLPTTTTKFINWDIICQESEEENTATKRNDNLYCISLYRINSLIDIVYIDDIIQDWDNSIYPYFLSLVVTTKEKENEKEIGQQQQQEQQQLVVNDCNNNNDNCKYYLQMITKLLQLLKKLFHLTRNNMEYIQTIQTNIVHIVCTIVETLVIVLPNDDSNDNDSTIIQKSDDVVDIGGDIIDSVAILKTSIQLLLDMFIDWTDMNNSGVGSYIDRYFVNDSIKQSIGIRIVSIAISGITITTSNATSTIDDTKNNNNTILEIIIRNRTIIKIDPTATWFYRWMNTLDWIQICSLFINNSTCCTKEREKPQHLQQSHHENEISFTTIGQSLVNLLQITTTIIKTWELIDVSAFETTTTTTTTTESSLTVKNNMTTDELSIVIYTLSLLRSIIMVTCVLKFPWSLLTKTSFTTIANGTSTDSSSNNLNTNDKIVSVVRCRLFLLQLYYKLLSQLITLLRSMNNDNPCNDKKTDTITTGSATTTKIVLPISTISDTIDLCVDAMDTLLSPAIQLTNKDNVTIEQIQHIQNSQKLLYHSRIYCSEQYSYIANNYK